MAVVTPTSPTFSTVIAPLVLASGTTLGTLQTLDLKTKFGAFLYPMIGRRAATALTRSGFIAIRRSHNQNASFNYPNTGYDFVSSIVAANSTTVSSGGASGTNTVVLTSGTSYAAGQWACLHSDDTSANRVEFVQVIDLATNTIAVDRTFKVSHNSADRVTNQADVGAPIWLPGGDVYEITPVNNSGQSLVFHCLAATYDSDTIT